MISFLIAHALALAYMFIGFGLGVFFAAYRQCQIEERADWERNEKLREMWERH